MKKIWGFISRASRSRTTAILVILILFASVPLTVFVAQQQQQTQQHASCTYSAGDQIVCNDATGEICVQIQNTCTLTGCSACPGGGTCVAGSSSTGNNARCTGGTTATPTTTAAVCTANQHVRDVTCNADGSCQDGWCNSTGTGIDTRPYPAGSAQCGACAPTQCYPNTYCSAMGQNCGTLWDGCKNISCGICTYPQTCSGGGTTNVCGGGTTATPTTAGCNGGYYCSIQSPPFSAGECRGGFYCDGTCVKYTGCGIPTPTVTARPTAAPTCTPYTCATYGNACGSHSNNCGSTISCGACPTATAAPTAYNPTANPTATAAPTSSCPAATSSASYICTGDSLSLQAPDGNCGTRIAASQACIGCIQTGASSFSCGGVTPTPTAAPTATAVPTACPAAGSSPYTWCYGGNVWHLSADGKCTNQLDQNEACANGCITDNVTPPNDSTSWKAHCATAVPTATPTAAPGETVLTLSIGLDGIGSTGDSKNQSASLSNKTPIKTTTATIFISDNKIAIAGGTISGVTLTYDSSSGKYKGTANIPSSITGAHDIRIGTLGHLIKKIGVTTGAAQSLSGDLIAGDIDQNGSVDILDHNILIGCWLPNKNSGQATCGTHMQDADLNADGKVDQLDYNLLIREFGQNGD